MTKKILNVDYGGTVRAGKQQRERRSLSIKSWHPWTPKVGRDGQAEEIRELCRALWALKEIYGICVCSNQAWVC